MRRLSMYPLYISAAGAQAQSLRMESISNNLANASTPGYKRDVTTFQARFAEAIERGADYPGSASQNDIGGGVMVRGTRTDFSPGTYKRTGIDTDLAIDGEGYFLVDREGQHLLGRAGNFRWSSDGALVTQEGFPVLSESLTPVVTDPSLGPVEITAQGVVRQAGNETALALVRPASAHELAKVGGNLFSAGGRVSPLGAEERRVMNGHLEMSRVEPALEMMELIETSRAFEANVNMIKHHDMMLSALVNRVLRTG